MSYIVDREETVVELHTRLCALQDEEARRATALGMYKRDLQRVQDEIAIIVSKLQAYKL
jgi:hypothetical protein